MGGMMKRKSRWLSGLTLIAAMLIVSATASNVLAKPIDGHSRPSKGKIVVDGLSKGYMPGEVIVKYKPGLSTAQKNTVKAGAGAIGEKKIFKRTVVLKLKTDQTVEDAINTLKDSGSVEYAEPNYILRASYVPTPFIPNDTDFGNQWGLDNTGQVVNGVAGLSNIDIDAPEAWDIDRGLTQEVKVAVLDTGIDLTHPDLSNQIWQNASETAGNEIDDDHNGYIDDVNGYNWAGISQKGGIDGFWWLGQNSTTDTTYYAQSIVGKGAEIKSIGISLRRQGEPTATVRVSLRNNLAGADLAYFDIAPTEITPDGQFHTVEKALDTPVLAANGTTYYIVVHADWGSFWNRYALLGSYADPYTEGDKYQKKFGGWTTDGYSDLWFYTNDNDNPVDDNGHGTHVSGIIDADTDNAAGVAGVTHGAKLVSLKVLDASGFATTKDAIAAVYYAADNGCKVINMSFGGYSSSQGFQDAITYAYDKGAVSVAAVGNEGWSLTSYPAGFDHVIGVGAIDSSCNVASFSNFNFSVDVVAPGVNIESTTWSASGAGYGYMTGTSMAAPHVTGIAALMFSLASDITPDDVEGVIEYTAIPREVLDLGGYHPPSLYPGLEPWDEYCGWGLVDAFDALEMVWPSPMPGPFIGYYPTTISTSTVFGSGNPPGETLKIWNARSGTLDWSITDNVSWLTVNPISGTNDGTATVSVNVTGLPVGTYDATITITAAGATNSPVYIPVRLTINPRVVVGYLPSSFSFSAVEGGGNPSDQTLTISNPEGGTFNWAVTDNAGWLSLNPTSGVDSGSVTVSVDISGLGGGDYTADITLTATGAVNSPVTIPVALHIGNPAAYYKYYFPWYDCKYMKTWVLVGNPQSTPTNVDIYLAGVKKETVTLNAGQSYYAYYDGEMGGPVKVVAEQSIFTTQRSIFDTSFCEVAGIKESSLDKTYYFPWYDNKYMKTWIFVGNPQSTNTSVDIYLAGALKETKTLLPDESYYAYYPDEMGGPVKVVANQPVFSTQRSIYLSSFCEVPGIANNSLATTYYYPLYDSYYMKTWVLVGNPQSTPATVAIYLGSALIETRTLAAGESYYAYYDGEMTGPVKVDATVPVFTTQRSLYGASFCEVPGMASTSLGTTYYFPWYDCLYMKTWVLVSNPQPTSVDASIYIGGSLMKSRTMEPGESYYGYYPSVMSGPVKVVASTPVVVTQRSIYSMTSPNSFWEISGIQVP